MAAPSPDAKRARKDMEEGPITLYSYWRSSCSYRVRIVLNLKGLAYDYVPVHLLKDGGQQTSAAHAARNPSKLVPALDVDGHTLAQSTAIVEYLEETRPEPALLPRDAYTRAVVRQVCCIISNDIQPVGNLKVLKHVASLVDGDAATKDAKKAEWSQHYIKAGFDAVEAVLSKHAGTYCVGDAITLADAFLVPQVYNARRFKVDMAAYPTICRVMAALEAVPAIAAAHPSKQPDAEDAA